MSGTEHYVDKTSFSLSRHYCLLISPLQAMTNRHQPSCAGQYDFYSLIDLQKQEKIDVENFCRRKVFPYQSQMSIIDVNVFDALLH